MFIDNIALLSTGSPWGRYKWALSFGYRPEAAGQTDEFHESEMCGNVTLGCEVSLECYQGFCCPAEQAKFFAQYKQFKMIQTRSSD